MACRIEPCHTLDAEQSLAYDGPSMARRRVQYLRSFIRKAVNSFTSESAHSTGLPAT
jgi:hypothetical protein